MYALVPGAVLAVNHGARLRGYHVLLLLSVVIKDFPLVLHPYDSRDGPPTRILFQDLCNNDMVNLSLVGASRVMTVTCT